ncbi:MAG: CDP-diacylglycerol--serine O-phosphatidyltransferase [Planctomycetia bacterium]|nr:CDP-diacylglycerol--serine O-phosphatidyltransferase [Planctomycetia bacterium]
MKRIRTVAVIPTLFTLANLLCGFYAIAIASRVQAPHAESDAVPSPSAEIQFFRKFDPANPVHNMFLCAVLIFLAMVFDALDGHVARLANSTSDFGAQLDSLSDLVTFGVAPAFLMVKMCPYVSLSYRQAIWVIAATFAACAALRLARFNVETGEDDDHMHFSGLPTPAAAAAIAGFALLFYTLRMDSNDNVHKTDIDVWVQRGLPLFALLVAMLMVSRIPYPHLVNQFLRGHRSFAHMVGLVFVIVAVLAIGGYALPMLAVAYVVLPPLKYSWQRLFARRTESEPLF